ELGFIEMTALKQEIINQISDIIYSIFDWNKGWYELRKEKLPEEPINLALPIMDIIFEGLRRMQNISALEKWLGDATKKFTFSTSATGVLQALNLNAREAFIASRIERSMSINDLLQVGGITKPEALKTICGLLVYGGLKWQDKEN